MTAPTPLFVTVRVTPHGGADRIEGVCASPDGHQFFKVRVNAPAEAGKANEAVCSVLAKALKVPASAVTIVRGRASRTKLLKILHPDPDLPARLAGLADL